MKKSKKLNPVAIVIIGILLAIRAFVVFGIFVRAFPSGGAESINDLVGKYQVALNDNDMEAYLKLLPPGERTNKEKEFLLMNFNKYSGNSYKMSVVEYEDCGKVNTADAAVSLLALDPLFAPIVADSYYVTVRVEDCDSYRINLIVYRCGNKYFLNDIQI